MVFTGLAEAIFAANGFVGSIWCFIECNSLKGYSAIAAFIVGLVILAYSLVLCYEIGLWRDEFVNSEKDKAVIK